MNHLSAPHDLASTALFRIDDLARRTVHGFSDPSRPAFDQEIFGELGRSVHRLDDAMTELDREFDRALRLLED